MIKLTYILLFSLLAFTSSLPQITWSGREPGLSISQQLGDGIRNVPIPSPWYFLKNKYYWNTNTGSNLSTVKPQPTTARIDYGPYTTRPYQAPNALSIPSSPATERPPQPVYIPTYQPALNTIAPSTTVNYVPTIATYPTPHQVWSGSDQELTNAHSRPITTQNPNLPAINTEIPKLPTFNNADTQSTESQPLEGTIDARISEDEENKQESVESGIQTTTTATFTTTTAITDDTQDLTSTVSTYDNHQTVADVEDKVTQSSNFNPGLLFSGPQICKKQQAYYGVGENHSFYVECNDYQPSLKLCPENLSFDSNVQWPEYPCKEI